jgi:hypothetical protein
MNSFVDPEMLVGVYESKLGDQNVIPMGKRGCRKGF